MAAKQHSAASRTDEPVEVFRQFAWHLAGSLAAGQTAGKADSVRATPKPHAAKGAGKR